MTSNETVRRDTAAPSHLLSWACRGRWPLVLFLSTMALAGYWRWFIMASVITFGAPGKTYFSPNHAIQGATINWCVDDVVLYRICKSFEIMRMTPAVGRPIDLYHQIRPNPPVPGRVPPKCRPFTVPSWENPNEGLGEAVLTGFVRSECSLSVFGLFEVRTPAVIDDFPTVKLTITRGEPSPEASR